MTYVLVSSNTDKLAEYQRLGLTDIEIERGEDLAEVSADPVTVVVYKAMSAGEKRIIEDTSLDVDGLDVGVNVRWMLDDLPQFIGRLAIWRVLIGVNCGEVINVYEGIVDGTITERKGVGGFGFDNVFKPTGYTQTLAELKASQTATVSAREQAVNAMLRKSPIISVEIASLEAWRGDWQGDD